MTATNPAIPATAEGGLETVRVITETLRIVTDKRLELYNLTERVADVVKRHDIKEGMVLLSSLHTTVALFVNEWQSALLHDIKGMLNKVVSAKDDWRHNDPQHSDCDRQNAHSHLQATLLGPSLTVPVGGGKLILGTWQQVVHLECDIRPRDRTVVVTVLGE